MKRSLIPSLFDALTTQGKLAELLDYVRRDNTLDMEFRGDKINIYYRGGNILDVTWKAKGPEFSFDEGYFEGKKAPAGLKNLMNSKLWNQYFPIVKQAMDFYFTLNKKFEREFQQLVVLENNNTSIANSTDFFILDIEYDTQLNSRFDLVGVFWPSNKTERKLQKNFKPHLVIFEMKYGDNALKDQAGLVEHLSDFENFEDDPARLAAFRSDMLTLFQQKRALNLIRCLGTDKDANKNEVVGFADKIELIFLLVNHDPASRRLKDELSKFKDPTRQKDLNCKFITSNFLGYGLYKENLFEFDEFRARFANQI